MPASASSTPHLTVPERELPTRGRFVTSVRTGLWAVVLSNILLSVADLRLPAAILPRLYVLKLLQLVVTFIGLIGVSRLRSQKAARILIVACAAVLCGLVMATGILANDLARAVFLCLSIAWGAAVLIPWGIAAQLMLAVLAAAAMTATVWFLEGSLDVGIYPALATALAFATSVLMTRHFERQRQERFRRARATRRSLRQSVAQRTAQLRASDQALRESEQRLRIISELTSDYAYCFVIDEDSNASLEWLTEASCLRITGFSAEEVRAHGGVILHRDDRQIARTRMENLLAGRDDTSEFRIITKSGAVRWIRDFGKPVWDDERRRIVRIYGAGQDITPRRVAENALRQSEELFRIAFESGPVGIAVVDQQFHIVDANPALCAMLGYTVGELRALDIRDISDPEDTAMERPMIEQIVAGTRERYEIDKRYHTKDGETLWAHVCLGIVRDHNGVATYGVGMIENITERRRTETALRASEKRFRLLAEQSSDVVLLAAADGNITYASPSLERVMGHPPREFLGRALFDLVHATDRKEARLHLEGLAKAQAGEVSTATFRFAHKDGSWRWVEVVGTNLLETPGVGAIFTTLRDVSHRQQQIEDAAVTAALARVGQELIASLDTGRLLDRLCRISKEVLDCDVTFTVVRSPEDHMYRLVAGYSDRSEDLEAARAVVLPEEAFTAVLAALNQDGVLQVQPASAATPWTAMPARYGITAILCTALRRGDEIIGIHAAGMRTRDFVFSVQQERIARGTTELASLALENVRLLKELERANRLKSEYLATMSHELLTPLNVIIGYTDLLFEEILGAVTSEQSQGLQRVRVTARELLYLIGETLDLSRLETHHAPLELVTLDPADLLRQVDEQTRDLQKHSAPQFIWNLPASTTTIKTDATKLRVVIKNLLHNAAKFTEQGSVTVDVRVCGGGVEIAIADTGIGIAPDILPIIFEPFRHGDASATMRREGVGLGLHIVRRLVDVLGGTVNVDSALRRGSRFCVWLPKQGPPVESLQVAKPQLGGVIAAGV